MAERAPGTPAPLATSNAVSNFHDGSAATLEAVASTYNVKRGLGLAPQEVAHLAQYLKSL